MIPSFSLDICHINQITHSVERNEYVLNLFKKMDDGGNDIKDYYDIMANDDAHADSLVESPEPLSLYVTCKIQ